MRIALSGLRRSWPSTAANISLSRSVSVRCCSSWTQLLLLAIELEEHVRLVLEDAAARSACRGSRPRPARSP